jgi:hypothetical protein
VKCCAVLILDRHKLSSSRVPTLLWKTVGKGISSSLSPLAHISVITTACWSACYKDGFVFLCPRKSNTLVMTNLHYESKTDLSLRCKYCEKFHVFQGWTRGFSVLDGCVTHFCHTTPTECPRTTTDTSVNAPVAVHIDFRGYLQYFCISSFWKYVLQYATETRSAVN